MKGTRILIVSSGISRSLVSMLRDKLIGQPYTIEMVEPIVGETIEIRQGDIVLLEPQPVRVEVDQLKAFARNEEFFQAGTKNAPSIPAHESSAFYVPVLKWHKRRKKQKRK